MLLTLENIKDIARGCARVAEQNGQFVFMRFTEKQAQAYLDIDKREFFTKTYASAGVRLAFTTDSNNFTFDYNFSYGSSRKFGHFDVYVDGKMKYHFGAEGPEATFGRANISLPEGDKKVEIHFPWSYRTDISNVTIDDGAYIKGAYRPHTLICFGDSITHGYDAFHPSLAYPTLLASLLDADYINKGIGGDIFFPALLDEAECPDPDYITVAYGSNDWDHCTAEEFEANYREFLSRLVKLYPKSEKFIISVIWHRAFNSVAKMGLTVPEQNAWMEKICREYPSLHFIDGSLLTPHRKEFYTDSAHPNETCFAFYAANLYAEMQKVLNK